jgi:hypothetical protein
MDRRPDRVEYLWFRLLFAILATIHLLIMIGNEFKKLLDLFV